MTEILLLEMTAGWMLIRVFLRLQFKSSGSKESCLHICKVITSVSKKSTQSAVVCYYCAWYTFF